MMRAAKQSQTLRRASDTKRISRGEDLDTGRDPNQSQSVEAGCGFVVGLKAIGDESQSHCFTYVGSDQMAGLLVAGKQSTEGSQRLAIRKTQSPISTLQVSRLTNNLMSGSSITGAASGSRALCHVAALPNFGGSSAPATASAVCSVSSGLAQGQTVGLSRVSMRIWERGTANGRIAPVDDSGHSSFGLVLPLPLAD